MYKHYHYLQSILKQKLFTIVIKNAKLRGLGWKILKLVIKGVEHER